MTIADYGAQIERLEYFYQISVTRYIFLFAVTEYQLNFFIAAAPSFTVNGGVKRGIKKSWLEA